MMVLFNLFGKCLMDYLHVKIFTTKFYVSLILLLPLIQGYGFDSGASCSPKSARRGRAQVLSAIPCDLSIQPYCNLPGNLYPWNAVRRFVHENQGLMKRMYGNIRHISVLRTEINNNDIGLEDVEQATARYSRSGWKRNKYLYTDFQKAKNNDVLTEPYFRRAPTQRTTAKSAFTTSKIVTTKSTLTTAPADLSNASEKSNDANEYQSDAADNGFNNEIELTVLDSQAASAEENPFEKSASNNSNSKRTNPIRDNIKIVGAPNLTLQNKTEAATISTTLKMLNVKPIETTISSILMDDVETRTFETETVSSSTSTSTTFTDTEDTTVNTTITSVHHNGDGEDVVIISKQANKTNRPADDSAQLFQDAEEKKESNNFNSRGVNACPVKEEVVAPFWANNTRGEVLALLNLYPFEQYVHWEKCTNENKQMYCREGCRCEQQYRLHRLLAYDPHNECRGIFSDWFRFPSCCICKCYDIPFEFRVTSRSPRSMVDGDEQLNNQHPIDIAEDEVRRAIYDQTIEEDWYLGPRDTLNEENEENEDDFNF